MDAGDKCDGYIEALKLLVMCLALTADVETSSGQNVSSSVSMTHQVVSRLLPGAVEVVHGDRQSVVAQHRVAAAGETDSVERPVQRAGRQADLGAQSARGRQSGADAENWILGRHQGHVWVQHKHTDPQQLLLFFFNLVMSSTGL